MTAPELLKLNIIDAIIPEPLGCAHRDISHTASNVSNALETHFNQLQKIPIPTLLKQREEKFRNIGAFHTQETGSQTIQTANS